MYAFGVREPRVVTVISCVLKASYFIHRDFTVVFRAFLFFVPLTALGEN